MFVPIVSWPSAPVTKSLVLHSIDALETPHLNVTSTLSADTDAVLQWSTYDDIDHELTHSRRESVLSSSYTFRKGLIRKHHLSRCITMYVAKHPESILVGASPKTYEIELSFVDELDEMFLDELWELGKELQDPEKWWILKPGMADRGNGIRLFNSKLGLEKIFQDFEEAESDEDGENQTSVVTSQLRHFVIQEYLMNPLLIDPSEVSIHGSLKPDNPQGHKFHLRAYVLASGALKLYLFDKVLALFSTVPYAQPSAEEDEDGQVLTVDLAPHLTNTSLQTDRGEEGVRLFDELVFCHILSGQPVSLTTEDAQSILGQMTAILAETFKAALENPVHFQPLPNAFELFGVDFLLTDSPGSESRFQLKLLEINAEPAIELTGPRLSWILKDLFTAIGKVCVEPFFQQITGRDTDDWSVGDTRHGLIKCLDVEVRGPDRG